MYPSDRVKPVSTRLPRLIARGCPGAVLGHLVRKTCLRLIVADDKASIGKSRAARRPPRRTGRRSPVGSTRDITRYSGLSVTGPGVANSITHRDRFYLVIGSGDAGAQIFSSPVRSDSRAVAPRVLRNGVLCQDGGVLRVRSGGHPPNQVRKIVT